MYGIPITKEKIIVNIINKSYILYNISVTYGSNTNSKISYAFYGNIQKILESKVNKTKIPCTIKKMKIGSEIICDINKISINDTFNVLFLANTIRKYKNNIYEFYFPKGILDLTKEIETKVILPPTAFIAESDVGSSINPTNFRLSLDHSGRRIIILWHINNPKLGNRIDFSVLFEMPASIKNQIQRSFSIYSYILSILSVLILSGIGFLIYKRKHEHKIINVLKEDERFVLEVIKELGNGCKHKDIVKKTKFSKAKVSRILLELQKRKLIRLERVGKNTKIFLE